MSKFSKIFQKLLIFSTDNMRVATIITFLIGTISFVISEKIDSFFMELLLYLFGYFVFYLMAFALADAQIARKFKIPNDEVYEYRSMADIVIILLICSVFKTYVSIFVTSTFGIVEGGMMHTVLFMTLFYLATAKNVLEDRGMY